MPTTFDLKFILSEVIEILEYRISSIYGKKERNLEISILLDFTIVCAHFHRIPTVDRKLSFALYKRIVFDWYSIISLQSIPNLTPSNRSLHYHP